MKLKICSAHQMAIMDNDKNNKWHSFYFIFNQIINKQISEVQLEYGHRCPYCHQLDILLFSK